MASFFIPENTLLSYVSSFDGSVKNLKASYARNVVVDNAIIDISLGVCGNNTFFLGVTPVEMVEFNIDSYDWKKHIEFVLPIGTKVTTDAGIPQVLVESLSCRVHLDSIVSLGEGTLLFDSSASVDLQLKKRCSAKIRSVLIRN